MVGSSTHRGNILNVLYRASISAARLGWLAHRSRALLAQVNEIGLVILHASAEGRRLYESLGFQPSNEMQIRL
jgi:hypothetical protein